MNPTEFSIADGMRVCPLCKASGERVVFSRQSYKRVRKVCEICTGIGQVPEAVAGSVTCVLCKGNGVREEENEDLCAGCNGIGYRTLPAVASNSEYKKRGSPVFVLTAGTRFTAHMTLVELLNSLGGVLRICDPYLGVETLPVLAPVGKREVRFLTSNLPTKRGVADDLVQVLKKFRQEFATVEFRRSVSDDFRDRYVVTVDAVVLVGHGLKDSGSKDSFIVHLKRDVDEVGPVIDNLIASFDSRWDASESLHS